MDRDLHHNEGLPGVAAGQDCIRRVLSGSQMDACDGDVLYD